MHAGKPPPPPRDTLPSPAAKPAPEPRKLNRHQRRVLAAVQRSPAKMKKWKAAEASLPAEETSEEAPE